MKHPVKLRDTSKNDIKHPLETILNNRGIKDWKHYINLTEADLCSPYLLKNIEAAAQLLVKHIENNSTITILVDCDVDGFTSAAILFNYIYDLGFHGKMHTMFHTGKQHGLTDTEIKIPEDTKLLLIPDAGSNDVQQCRELREKYMDIIILDHHVMDVENPFAVVVNNQDGSYPNKELSGAGVVYKFCQVVDDTTWNNFANKYLDLAAIGNIGDNMDLRSLETKYIAMNGMVQIMNPCIQAVVDNNGYKVQNPPTIIDIQFYVVPAMNALIRVGTQAQKQRMFEALTYSKNIYQYTPTRGKNAGKTLNLTAGEYSAKEMASAKYKQNKEKEKAIEEIIKRIDQFGLAKNKILFCNVNGILNPSLTGVVAINIAQMYNRPCVLLRTNSNMENMFGGSMRNISDGTIENFKDFLSNTGCFEFVAGHENAAGVAIKKENITKAIEVTNEILKNVELEKFYNVDFIIDASQLTVPLIREIESLRRVWCYKVEEAIFYVKNIPVLLEACQKMGKTGTSWKYIDQETFIEYVCFHGGEMLDRIENQSFVSKKECMINAVCKLSVNQFGGIATPQVVLEAYEVIK